MPASSQEGYDKLNAAIGCESRQPYLDRRMIEFCMALPSEQRISGGANRVIVRRAMTDLLPESVRSRLTKGAASGGCVHALVNHGRNELDRMLRDGLKPVEQWIDLNAFPRIYDRLLADRTPRDAWALWATVTLARWLTVSCPKSDR
jgi:asparagine synthase (glutamine-hydrolysing)